MNLKNEIENIVLTNKLIFCVAGENANGQNITCVN